MIGTSVGKCVVHIVQIELGVFGNLEVGTNIMSGVIPVFPRIEFNGRVRGKAAFANLILHFEEGAQGVDKLVRLLPVCELVPFAEQNTEVFPFEHTSN